jgi:hypothetical protein
LGDDMMWRDRDRFPLGKRGGEIRLLDEEPSSPGVRPFGLQNLTYSTGENAYRRPRIELCPERQIGLVDGKVAHEVVGSAPSMTKYDTDGQDILVVDYAEDD